MSLFSILHSFFSRPRMFMCREEVLTKRRSHWWSLHRAGTPHYTLLCTLAFFLSLLELSLTITLYFLRLPFRRRVPTGVGLNPTSEERTITPQRRCKPVLVVPDSRWQDALAFWREPTHADIADWMRRGERAVWPMVRCLHVRMDVEVELHSKSFFFLRCFAAVLGEVGVMLTMVCREIPR